MKLSNSLGSEKPFFDLWRTELVMSMTLVEDLPEGQLYYSRSPYSCDVSVVVGPLSLLVAYPTWDSPDEIRKPVRLWHDALTERRKPTGPFTEIGHPVYAAEYDPTSSRVIAAWFYLGDWCGLAMEHNRPLPKEWHQLPTQWPEAYRDQIFELAERRSNASR